METYSITLKRKSGNKGLHGGNQMISSNDRMHHAVKAQITKFLREEAATAPTLPKPYSPDKPCHIYVDIQPPTNRRMDAPNWYPTVKALVDGLVDQNWFTDDNNSVIKMTSFYSSGLSGIKGSYVVTIHVTDYKEVGNARLLL